ncbi:hypothetical protein [Opitutus sp. ER46]|uniref:hypothetical protein n=1 Tax=Opitutus sp. ER46 TaxID=2161864 RepID=UPI000D30A8FF|nr:hypothetical protein [Opitutus sp. ER46]PTX98942.1 hypothetical protein DB354_02650 [Opitutus sp. ER46]
MRPSLFPILLAAAVVPLGAATSGPLLPANPAQSRPDTTLLPGPYLLSPAKGTSSATSTHAVSKTTHAVSKPAVRASAQAVEKTGSVAPPPDAPPPAFLEQTFVRPGDPTTLRFDHTLRTQWDVPTLRTVTPPRPAPAR